MFNVTIQNHSGFEYATGVVDGGITITDGTHRQETAINYLNLIKKSDEAMEELITYFSQVKEPTVIVFYGDHEPRVSEDFYASFSDQCGGLTYLQKVRKRYMVPFLIWANYDIKEQDGIELSANYIAPYTKSVIGMPMTGYDKYLMDLYKDVPVINALYYQDAKGNMYDPDYETPYDEQVLDYSIVQYNGLVDGKHRVEDFFTLK